MSTFTVSKPGKRACDGCWSLVPCCCVICELTRQRNGWRNLSNEQAVLIEDLEHEVGRLREVLRRIIGYVESVRSVAELEEPHG